MESFDRSALIALADFVNGYAFKPEDFTEHGLPIIRIEQLKDSNAPFDFYHGKVPSENYIENDDLIFSWSASLFLQIWKRGKAVLNQHLFKVIPKPNVDKLLLKYCIEFNLPELTKSAHGSTMQHITRRELERFFVSIPKKKDVQSKIAEVLATVDRAIEQTEALIAKYHRIKTGLMHDLLTRGIDEHDQLRDPATHKFKNSPLGMIPEEWTAAVLSSITDLQVGYAFKSRDFVDNGGILLLRGDNVGYGQPDWSNPKYLLQNPAKHLKEYFLRDGDIVIGMDRTFTKQGCKISVLRKQDSPALLVQRVGRFLPKANAVGFLNALLSSLDFQNNLQKQEKGMDIPHLSKDEILSVPVIIPTLREMNEIARIANCLNENLESEKLSLLKFYRLKTGLMQDLLTGKVSVEPLLEPQNEDR